MYQVALVMSRENLISVGAALPLIVIIITSIDGYSNDINQYAYGTEIALWPSLSIVGIVSIHKHLLRWSQYA